MVWIDFGYGRDNRFSTKRLRRLKSLRYGIALNVRIVAGRRAIRVKERQMLKR
jgi:hypothetical protein